MRRSCATMMHMRRAWRCSLPQTSAVLVSRAPFSSTVSDVRCSDAPQHSSNTPMHQRTSNTSTTRRSAVSVRSKDAKRRPRAMAAIDQQLEQNFHHETSLDELCAASLEDAIPEDHASSPSTSKEAAPVVSAARNHALQAVVERITSAIGTYKMFMDSWSQVPSSKTVQRLEKRFNKAMEAGTAEAYTELRTMMEQRYAHPIKSDGDRSNIAFLLLYTRVLTHCGVFCLISFETQAAVRHFEEAIRLAQEACAVASAKAAHHPELRTEECVEMMEPQRLTPDASPSSSSTHGLGPTELHFGETAVVILRVLLANAHSCEQRFFDAAQSYECARQTMNRYPGLTLHQFVQGYAAYYPLSRSAVLEDMDQFYARSDAVEKAVDQGKAQLLLLQSQGAPAEKIAAIRLSLARIYRHGGMLREAQDHYEAYLDHLIDTDVEDDQCVMVELGRLLAFDAGNEQVGITYLETASELLLEEADASLPPASARRTAPLAASELRHAMRAAAALADTAATLHRLGTTGKALGLLEQALELLGRARLERMGAWMMMLYADYLSVSLFLDKALLMYNGAMKLLEGPHAMPTMQLSHQQHLVALSPSMVEAHLAQCLHLQVGDYRRAAQHYRHALRGDAATTTTTTTTQDAGKKNEEQRGRRRRTTPSSSSSSGTSLPVVSTLMDPASAHWAYTNYVGCLERLQAWPEAIEAQQALISIEAATKKIGLLPAYLKLSHLLQQSGEMEKQMSLCFFLFFLREEAGAESGPSEHFEVAIHFARCAYQLGHDRMGAVLLHAVQYVVGDYDTSVLLRYASCMSSLSERDKEQVGLVLDCDVSAEAAASIILRAANIIVAMTVTDERRTPSEVEVVSSTEADERLMTSLTVLSRGAFFFHRHGRPKQATQLYELALSFAERPPSEVRAAAYPREVGILLANFATLKATLRSPDALQLYQRAASICDDAEVASVVMDYYVQTDNHVFGVAFIEDHLPEGVEEARTYHMRLANLGTGAAWPTLNNKRRLAVMEHLLLGLGLDPSRLPAGRPPLPSSALENEEEEMSAEDYDVALAVLRPLFLDGVATTYSSESACFACYVMQMKDRHARFLNEMYKIVLRRFPNDTGVLINYAKLCLDVGCSSLARKYYAKAYGLAMGDARRTQCYANYLVYAFGDEQAGCGEVLYRRLIEEDAEDGMCQLHYANYLAAILPSPFKTEHHFERAMALDDESEVVCRLYGYFVWSCASSRLALESDAVKAALFDKAEKLLRRVAELQPNDPAALQQLGTFLGHRRNRFQESVEMLHKAHVLEPQNAEVVQQLCAVLVEECVRLQEEEQQRFRAAAQQGPSGIPFSSALRSLVASAKQSFEVAMNLDPQHRPTLEKYAQFAVSVLKDTALAVELWRRLQQLPS